MSPKGYALPQQVPFSPSAGAARPGYGKAVELASAVMCPMKQGSNVLEAHGGATWIGSYRPGKGKETWNVCFWSKKRNYYIHLSVVFCGLWWWLVPFVKARLKALIWWGCDIISWMELAMLSGQGVPSDREAKLISDPCRNSEGAQWICLKKGFSSHGQLDTFIDGISHDIYVYIYIPHRIHLHSIPWLIVILTTRRCSRVNPIFSAHKWID